MYKRLLNAITCGTKPTFVAESLGAVEYDVGEKGGLVNLTLYGSTNSKAKSGHPYNYNTYHVGTYDEEREGHFIKLRMRGEVFLDGEEFERLLALSSPQLYGGRSEDGRIIILTTTSNPSYIIPEGHFRSIKAPHTVNMDIQPESGENKMYGNTKMAPRMYSRVLPLACQSHTPSGISKNCTAFSLKAFCA